MFAILDIYRYTQTFIYVHIDMYTSVDFYFSRNAVKCELASKRYNKNYDLIDICLERAHCTFVLSI